MLDTLGLESPPISKEVIEKVEKFLNKYIGFEVESGDLKYEFTSGYLKGSYDSRISVRIMKERYVSICEPSQKTVVCEDSKGKKFLKPEFKLKHKLITEKCEPYLCIECSVHKSMVGHNVYGGSSDIQLTCKWLIEFIEKIVGVELPWYEVWQVRRIDYTQVFDLGSFEAVEEYIRGLKHSYYPRKTVLPFKFESIYVAGAKTTLKLYHKGPEFYKNDRKRLLKIGQKKLAEELQIIANNLLRVELEVKSKKLRELFGGRLPYVGELLIGTLAVLYDKEVFKLLRERVEPDRVEIYRTTESVENRLNDIYSKRQARNLFSTWIQLASLGEERVKQMMCEPTFYKHRKLILDANISWKSTDIIVNEKFSKVPTNFSPVTTDSRINKSVDVKILNLLREVAA